jgi:hypothetical protein
MYDPHSDESPLSLSFLPACIMAIVIAAFRVCSRYPQHPRR